MVQRIGFRRREFIALLGATVSVVAAQKSMLSQTTTKPLRIGVVHPVSPKGIPPNYVEFIDRLRELGYVEGDTLAVEYINLEGHLDRYDDAMRDRSGAASISSRR